MSALGQAPTIRLRTAFISDVHLGARECRADMLLEFLERVQLDTLILVGDIIDVWALRKKVYWPQTHTEVVRAILAKAKRGTKVIYVPGNHDELFRGLAGAVFGNLEVHRDYLHLSADGRQFWVLHGDEFDALVKCSPWLAWLGSTVYDLLLWLNRGVNRVRRTLGFPYWSLAAYLKHKAPSALKYIAGFEQAVVHEARRRGVDGVVCGHIHRAALTQSEDLVYCNDGDWVESCSALVEDFNGRMALWNWAERREELRPAAAVPARVGQAA